jgi:hypothetical protein
MNRIHRTLAVLLAFPLIFNTLLFGWGNNGHMAVAYDAYGQLNQNTKDRVETLLGTGSGRWQA